MQRRRLARSGRPADEEQAVGLGDQVPEPLEVVRRHTQLVDRDRFAGTEDAQDDVLEPAGGGHRRHAQFDVKRSPAPEADLAVLRPALLGDVEVGHDLQARHQRAAVGRRDLDVGRQRAIAAEADDGLFLARPRFDVDVGSALLVRLDDDPVHQADEFVVGSGAEHLGAALGGVEDRIIVEARQHVADRVDLDRCGEELSDELLELVARADAVHDPSLREDVVRHARGANALRITGNDDDPFLRLLDRQPLVGLDVIPLQVAQQLGRPQAVRPERLIGHAAELRQCAADRRQRHLEIGGQHLLEVELLAACRLLRQIEFGSRDDRVTDQRVVPRLRYRWRRIASLREGDGERLRQRLDALVGDCRKRGVRAIVDQLHDTEQFARLRVADRRHQHLLRAVTGALVDRFQETEPRTVFRQLVLVVDVAQVERPARYGNVAGDALLGNRQTDVLVRVEARLDFRDDAVAIIADEVDRQAVGVEELADVFRHLENDLVDVARAVDPVGDALQVLEEAQASTHVAEVAVDGPVRCRHAV
ncbi:MAG: hypothetical protein AW08_02079 [Candidatus Accumulibacter adjunctus]|uniref:Uncharacterized protein n=1 Tax=Candidatus Accumulibacter adjunctus TaxID=1454001 RepID=A0A011PLP3_9PROT|nr:MAG: hypothetical protein AW08_02079 [Candidatus Accumulibacter adjunctus]